MITSFSDYSTTSYSVVNVSDEDVREEPHVEEYALDLLTAHTKQEVLAPALSNNFQYHAFFIHHKSDNDWVNSIVDKLEVDSLAFKCCFYDRDSNMGLTYPQSVLFGVKQSLKTALILSPSFLLESWVMCEGVLGALDSFSSQNDIIIIVLHDCELPETLKNLPKICVNSHGWWTKLLARLALPDDICFNEESVLNVPSQEDPNASTHTCYLLVSLKSQCDCCGREIIDPLELSEELVTHGVQFPDDQYAKAIHHLMKDMKFQCHVWCFNMPLAMVSLTVILALCLIIIPLAEHSLFYHGPRTGLELIHGGVAWLTILTLYIAISHLVKKYMKSQMYKSLSKVNEVFIKYNLLVGIENLGLADCNKYYLHFFHYEIEPCLLYLQEMLIGTEECNNHHTNQMEIEIEFDENNLQNSTTDQSVALEKSKITNTFIQSQAELMLVDYSGEYINMLISKRIEKPRRQRHSRGIHCLCQYVELKLKKRKF